MTAFLWISIAASLLLLAHSAYRQRSVAGLLLAIIVTWLVIVLSLIFLISDDITGTGISEATFFHIRHGIAGIDPLQFPRYLTFTGVGLVAASVASYAAWQIHRRRLAAEHKRSHCGWPTATSVALAMFSLAAHPGTWQSAAIAGMALGMPTSDELETSLRLDANRSESDRRPRNLIYIYAESLERTLFDEQLFPGLVPQLKALETSSLSIHGIGQAPLTDWTMAGMVASQCGIPLAPLPAKKPASPRTPQHSAEMIPGGTCVGDLLKYAGYRLLYMGGADAAFSGKAYFYRTHGFDEVIGKQQLLAKYGTNTATSKWGVYDDLLLNDAFDRYRILAAQDEPFALFVLTLDTHAPGGHETPSCKGVQYGDGSNAMLNAIHCTDQLIANFVRRIEADDDGSSVVVVASDHLQMRGDISDLLDPVANRRENLFLLRGQSISPGTIKREATTLDIAPTLLSALDWEAPAIGLGRSLLAENPTLSEKLGSRRYYRLLEPWRLKQD